jgi:hypothetical protein
VSERGAADYQTPSCMKNPEQGVMVGSGTVLLTIAFSVVIINHYRTEPASAFPAACCGVSERTL